MSEEALTVIKTEVKVASAYLASLKSEVGRSSVRSVLKKIAFTVGSSHYDLINWSTMNAASVQAIVSKLAQTPTETGNPPSPATMALTLSVLKGVARASWQCNLIDTDNYQRIKDLKAPRGSRLPKGRDIEPSERFLLMHNTHKDNTPSGVRDTALLAVLISTGMRRGEVVSLSLQDVDLTTGKTIVRGKGDKERTVYIKNGAMKALQSWLQVRGNDVGALFCVINKGKQIHPHHYMSTTALHLILQKRLSKAELSNISAHDFRRTFAGELLDSGADISTVASLMGHSDPKTTAKYDRRGERRKEQVSGFIQVLY